MSIIIYTYSNPYKICFEKYWSFIKNSFQICASQTLAGGLCQYYDKDFFEGKLTTVDRFIKHLYNDWESDVVNINQRAEIDNLIDNMEFDILAEEEIDLKDVRTSLKRNRGFVLESIRIMFELEMNPEHIKNDELNYEQKCIVEIYKELIETKNKFFRIKKDQSEDEINKAIDETMQDALRKEEYKDKLQQVNKDLIVINGIHQFTPLMLRMIELLSKYKDVIILFNYVPDYKNVYQTWLNVYSLFESKINISENNFCNDSQSFPGGKIADDMAALISGSTANIDYTNKIDVIKFDNPTEFAGYVAKMFEEAEKRKKEDNFLHSTLYYMDEQIYAANSSVNDILKIYFPEQFGERNFLDYPIGHFFISVSNMWNEATHTMEIRNLQDVYECLSCGIINERFSGELASLFDQCMLYIKNETTLKGIIKKLKRLKRKIDFCQDDKENALLKVEYFNLRVEDIERLLEGLNDLDKITKQFFEEFKEESNEFKSFYKKVSDVLVSQVLDKEDIDPDFRDIVERLLMRLDEVKDIEAKASFDCLKETMNIYLQQIPKAGKGANWIVRNFAQIDGDVLRSARNNRELTYHFACLSDEDMSITHKDEFPWPLDISFFERAQAPVDWKYQVYVTSRMEYKNFKRYALIAGLAFSKAKIKLSYIKNENRTECDLYYLLKILNANEIIYGEDLPNSYCKNSDYIQIENENYKQFDQNDLIRYRLCKYRFLLESVVDGKAVYKDEFLLKQYLTILLEHKIRKDFSGKQYIKNVIHTCLIEELDELSAEFPFLSSSDLLDILKAAEEYIEKNAVSRGKFADLKQKQLDYMEKRENFLVVPNMKQEEDNLVEAFKESTQKEIDDLLNEENLKLQCFTNNYNKLCDKCCNKDICLELFKTKKNGQ